MQGSQLAWKAIKGGFRAWNCFIFWPWSFFLQTNGNLMKNPEEWKSRCLWKTNMYEVDEAGGEKTLLGALSMIAQGSLETSIQSSQSLL